MTVYRWEPRREIATAGRKLRQLFDDVENGWQSGLHIELGTFQPRVDISETKEAVHVHAELPGMKPEDVKITLAEGVLTLRGKKERAAASAEQNFHRMERTHGEFVRQFALPANIDEDATQASFDDGVLHITIAKREPERPKEREVKIGNK
jgi:HSP20 family protein